MGETLDDLIAEFVRLDADCKELNTRRKEVAAEIAGIAFENKGDQNTVHLQSTAGQQIKTEFRYKTEWDNEQLFTVKNLVGADVFDSLFTPKLEFTAKRRDLKKFLNTVSSSEAIETAKGIIKDAQIETQQTPYVSVEKS